MKKNIWFLTSHILVRWQQRVTNVICHCHEHQLGGGPIFFVDVVLYEGTNFDHNHKVGAQGLTQISINFFSQSIGELNVQNGWTKYSHPPWFTLVFFFSFFMMVNPFLGFGGFSFEIKAYSSIHTNFEKKKMKKVFKK